MEIKIDIQKKYVWILSLFIVAVGFVIAYGGTNPQQMGHTIGEVDGVDQKVIDVMNAQAATFLSGKQLAEVTYFSVGTQDQVPIGGQTTSLAAFNDVYGRCCRGDVDGAFEQRGCNEALRLYCVAKQYTGAVPLHTSCGWSYDHDSPCPNVPGCTVEVLCIKPK